MKGHVLLVEDEGDVRRSIARVIRLRGYRVTEASGGEEALDAMRESEDFDLILLDLMMPDISGWEVRERQLADDLLPEVPVVVLSGASPDLSDEESAVEAADHLVKPVRPSELYVVLGKYCGEE